MTLYQSVTESRHSRPAVHGVTTCAALDPPNPASTDLDPPGYRHRYDPVFASLIMRLSAQSMQQSGARVLCI